MATKILFALNCQKLFDSCSFIHELMCGMNHLMYDLLFDELTRISCGLRENDYIVAMICDLNGSGIPNRCLESTTLLLFYIEMGSHSLPTSHQGIGSI